MSRKQHKSTAPSQEVNWIVARASLSKLRQAAALLHDDVNFAAWVAALAKDAPQFLDAMKVVYADLGTIAQMIGGNTDNDTGAGSESNTAPAAGDETSSSPDEKVQDSPAAV